MPLSSIYCFMSQIRRIRQQEKKLAQQAEEAIQAAATVQPPVRHAWLWLAIALLAPNLGALACNFLLDDMPLLVDNESLHIHSLSELARIWTKPYWTDRGVLTLYRPFTQTLWAAIWAIGHGGNPVVFHALCLGLGLAVVFLLYRFLLAVHAPPRSAFVAALLFALFPIHTEATTSVAGSAELLAAALGLGALALFYQNQETGEERRKMDRFALQSGLQNPFTVLTLFALAVLSKESAAAFAAIPLAFPPKNWRSRKNAFFALGAGAIIAGSLFAHSKFSSSSFIPLVDNPMGSIEAFPRVLTALWVQCLYVFKTIFPITLSADYSFMQIPLVLGLGDWRAWAGLALAGGALFLAIRKPLFRAPILVYAILFASTANILFSIGTIMGERLAYAPSIGIALLLAYLLTQNRHWKTALLAIALIYGARTAFRNLDWLNAGHFYAKLVQTSPQSAKSWYFYGALQAGRGDDLKAVEAYDTAIAIFPEYSEAFHNRGNALARLGRRQEAMDSYRQCLRFDPGHAGAAYNLAALASGLPLNPARRKL